MGSDTNSPHPKGAAITMALAFQSTSSVLLENNRLLSSEMKH